MTLSLFQQLLKADCSLNLNLKFSTFFVLFMPINFGFIKYAHYFVWFFKFSLEFCSYETVRDSNKRLNLFTAYAFRDLPLLLVLCTYHYLFVPTALFSFRDTY